MLTGCAVAIGGAVVMGGAFVSRELTSTAVWSPNDNFPQYDGKKNREREVPGESLKTIESGSRTEAPAA
jgi:hypothetical protein